MHSVPEHVAPSCRDQKKKTLIVIVCENSTPVSFYVLKCLKMVFMLILRVFRVCLFLIKHLEDGFISLDLFSKREINTQSSYRDL